MTLTPPVALPDDSAALDALAAVLADRYGIERELGRGGMATQGPTMRHFTKYVGRGPLPLK